MTDYYVDPTASGANDGGGDGTADDPTDTNNWTDAWTNAQSAFDTAIAGDVVYCRGTQTLSAIIDVDTNSGNDTTGMIRFIGVEGLNGNNGVRFVLDGNSAVANCLKCTGINYIHLENFEVKNATSTGIEVSPANCLKWAFVNCSAHNNGGHGINGDRFKDAPIYIRTTCYSNSADGLNRPIFPRILFCSFHDNTGDGFDATSTNAWITGSLFYDNGDKGIENVNSESVVFNCVVNRNTAIGFNVIDTVGPRLTVAIGNRITNHSGAGDIGLDCGNGIVYHGWNYYEDNDGNNLQNASLAVEILNDGAATDAEDQADTNEGYTDKTDGAEDFNLRSDATNRRLAITIPTV